MWDERYDCPDYLFGTEAADFVKAEAHRIAPGSHVLAVADGEGRNSVFLALQGHRVTAFDSSEVALVKARKLARQRTAQVDFRAGDILTWDWAERRYDVLLAVFIQFLNPADRARVLPAMATALRPGGLMLLHGYAPRQIEYATGGPPCRENMYTLAMLREIFSGFDVLKAADYDAIIDEGPGHSGRSGLIDFVARKPG